MTSSRHKRCCGGDRIIRMQSGHLVRLITLLAVAGLSVQALGASNSSLLRLLRVLRDKGSISAEEYEELRVAAEEEAQVQSLPPAASTSKLEPSPSAPAGPSSTVGSKGPAVDSGAPKLAEQPVSKAPKWYDRVSFRGYTQFRYHAVLDDEGAGLNVPNDRSVSTTESFMLRRARLILSGDVTDHLYIYLQPDFNASPSDGQYSAQLRDVYADVSFDAAKEYRVRLGQSKVPFGYSNLQSSQNRAALERPDALNSAVEGERDIGAFFYWAPAEIRERFRHLVASGLKGSGDYGVAGIGLYSGQGLNRSDRNGDPHVVARLSYPIELPRKQILELGVQGYTGRFVVDTENVASPSNTAVSVRPSASPSGVADERVGFTAVLYPQPFGFEAEWNFGRGPELSSDFRSISADFLQGGYVQLNYKAETPAGTWFPFVRWQRYEGGRKFARNAPDSRVEEVDVGVEWSLWKEVEVVVSYTHTFHRTNTRTAPYGDAAGSDRIGLQLQWNY
jgi:Phosphate-selective porin O and P